MIAEWISLWMPLSVPRIILVLNFVLLCRFFSPKTQTINEAAVPLEPMHSQKRLRRNTLIEIFLKYFSFDIDFC